jgi:hypothetical protein
MLNSLGSLMESALSAGAKRLKQEASVTDGIRRIRQFGFLVCMVLCTTGRQYQHEVSLVRSHLRSRQGKPSPKTSMVLRATAIGRDTFARNEQSRDEV